MREVIAGICLLVCLFLISSSASAMAWPYYGVGGGAGDEGWHGGYHGSWGFTGPYCGYPPEPCVPPVVTVPVPVPVPVQIPVPVPVPVPVPPCGCGGGPIATAYYGGSGSEDTGYQPPGVAYAQSEQTVGQSQTHVNNVYDSPGAYVSNYGSQGQYANGQGS